MARSRTYPKGKRLCIFCEGKSGARLSHEHIFPDWLRDVFRRSPTDTYTHGVTSWADDDFERVVTAQRKKQGLVSTRQVRVVCEACNNEWMSDMEKRSQALLLSLLEGRPMMLESAEQQSLATWITKTVMAAEYVDPSKIAIPQTDRTLFIETRAPLSQGWWIWIAGSQGARWLTGIHHFSARANFGPVDPTTRNIPNLQSTTIGLGRLLVYCVSSSSPHFTGFVLSNPNRSDLLPLWPLAGKTITWPPQRPLGDDAIDVIANNLLRAFPAGSTGQG